MEGDKKGLKNSSHTNRFVCVADIYTVIGTRRLLLKNSSDPLFFFSGLSCSEVFFFLCFFFWKLKVLLVATVNSRVYYLPVSRLLCHFLSLFRLRHLPLPVAPGLAACPAMFASPCVLSTRGDAPPPCFCQLIHLRVFIPVSCAFVVFALRDAADSFPLTLPLFLCYFFESTRRESKKFPTIHGGNVRAPWPLREHCVFDFPSKFTVLSLPWMMMMIALTMQERGENTSWPCDGPDII